ncbi:MAG: amidohydrolase family protein [Chloroflexi bacterium]|nr:amidohydrolase family protein [Chloroflexota bacterium]
MEYSIISADSHIDLAWMPHDVFVSNAPTHLKDQMPRVVDTEKGLVWRAGEDELCLVGVLGAEETNPGVVARDKRMAETGFFEDSAKGIYHPTVPELRIKDQDLDGVDAEVIYGLSFGPEFLRNPKTRGVVYSIYNGWAADFCSSNPQRFIGLACLPHHDPKAAADEVRRGADLGLRGCELRVGLVSRAIFYKDWDVLWQASEECNMPISFHILGLHPRAQVPEDTAGYGITYWSVALTMAQLDGVEFLASIIFSGACERFPDFKFVLGECGVSWIPYILDRMDHEGGGHPELKMLPSDYWRRQGFSTFQQENCAGDLIPLVGENNVMWGSDYPHHDGVWPDSQETIVRNLKNLRDETARRKVICDNVAGLYRIK